MTWIIGIQKSELFKDFIWVMQRHDLYNIEHNVLWSGWISPTKVETCEFKLRSESTRPISSYGKMYIVLLDHRPSYEELLALPESHPECFI